MKNEFKYICVILLVLTFSCRSKKGITTKKGNTKNKTEKVVVKNKKPKIPIPKSTADYISMYASRAMEEMRVYKIPASITLAQGILESASGKSRLSVKANNHFGIKCHGWTGGKIYHDDDRKQECFRTYKKPEQSYKDHSEFLTTRKRYAHLFKLKANDYVGWAKGLRASGYATDKKYPQKLISLIENYKLYKYDEKVLGSKKENGRRVNHKVTIYIVEKGDTLYVLSKRYNTTVSTIKTLNNMTSNDLAIGQELMIPN